MKYIRKILQALVLVFLLTSSVSAQGPIYLPIILKGYSEMPVDPILRISGDLDGERITIDLLGPHSGFKLEDPNWQPAIAQPKGGGAYVSSSLAPGRTLTDAEDDNVVETIPLSVRGKDQDLAIQTLRKLLQLLRQGRDYWTEEWEYDNIWLEARPACNDCFTGYSRLIQVRISNIGNVFGQPFFTALNPEAVIDGVTLIAEREPYWRPLPPGEIIGPLYNLPRNPDFELWNFGIADSEPDNWTNLESVGITGTNNREETFVQYGQFALRVEVRQSTGTNLIKGVTQVVDGTRDGETYTMLAWIRSDGVSNGVGRLLVTTAIGNFEVYRASNRHGWTLYTQVITIGTDDTVGINCEILSTDANADGTVYFDGLMFVEGNWQQEAIDGVLPWMSSSHIVNHWDQPEGALVEAGDINWVDAWNVPGDVPALVRLELVNNTELDIQDPVMIYKTIRIGQRRTRDVMNFANYFDPVGVADATASSDDRLDTIALSPSWLDVATRTIIGPSNTRDNQGRFRVFARVYDPKGTGDPTLEGRLSYFLGVPNVSNKILDAVPAEVRAQWTILNLTPNAAMVQDQKFAPDAPAQLGYIVQMRRGTGNDVARLDYVLTMPTDGGYLEVKLDPALFPGDVLVADNTASQMISSTGQRVGWQLMFDTGRLILHHMKEYNGDLYVTGWTGVNGNVFRFASGVWSTVFSTGSAPIYQMEVYDGYLYVGISTGEVFRSQDGISWASAFTIAGGSPVRSLQAFGGLLYVGIGGGAGTIHTWNGTVTALVYNTGDDRVFDFEAYGGRLYAGTGTTPGRVHVYDPVTNVWALSTDTGQDEVQALQEFEGRLYAGTNGLVTLRGELHRFDGSVWEVIEDFTPDIIDEMRLASFDGNLYVSGDDTGGSPVFQSGDGDNFVEIYNSQQEATFAMLGYQGKLYIATSGDGLIFSITFESVQINVADFQGGAFTAPNRRVLTGNTRRHRWFFSYDRDGFINNLDDAGLVGLGYAPQYLTLRGAD